MIFLIKPNLTYTGICNVRYFNVYSYLVQQYLEPEIFYECMLQSLLNLTLRVVQTLQVFEHIEHVKHCNFEPLMQ